jgi:hypothetical protein
MWSNREILDYGRSLLASWKKKNAEILSCFDLEKLQERMMAYADLEMGKSIMQELAAASEQDRSADAVAQVWFKCYNESFIMLYERGVLAHLKVVDELPEAAQAQLAAMADDVLANYPEPEVAAPVVVRIDPVDQCRIDFHEMGSSAFKRKYIDDTRNRPIYETAITRGVL